jgi:hypothetical protein
MRWTWPHTPSSPLLAPSRRRRPRSPTLTPTSATPTGAATVREMSVNSGDANLVKFRIIIRVVFWGEFFLENQGSTPVPFRRNETAQSNDPAA